MKKSKISTIIIVVVTIVLAGIAIFTAIKLYNLRDQAVAPNVPSSYPVAQENTSCSVLTFSIATPTATATATGTSESTPTTTSTATSTGTSVGGPTSTSTTISQGSTATPATTTTPELPDAGTSWPTVVGGGLGILIIFGALLLAL